jgi:hypothetical protein
MNRTSNDKRYRDQRTGIIQTWTFDQGDVWCVKNGTIRPIEDLDEDHILNIIAFLYRDARRYARVYVEKKLDDRQVTYGLFGISQTEHMHAALYDDEMFKLAVNDAHAFITRMPLMQALWKALALKRLEKHMRENYDRG